MPVQRSVYRIEELGGLRSQQDVSVHKAEAVLRHAELMTELRALRALLDARPSAGAPAAAGPAADDDSFKTELGTLYDAVRRTKQEIATLMVTGFANPEISRVSQELNAVVGNTETATHVILDAGEEIEEAAKTLAAAIKNVQDQDLARDIMDQVTRIFEACNFQDLTGQRINKLVNTLKFIEDHILRLMKIWGGVERFAEFVPQAQAEHAGDPKLINGPKTDGQRGYVSQKEIDEMFANR
ncbi:MAG: protein phosphatase CheZ [Xanthobacteraceae bacterium]